LLVRDCVIDGEVVASMKRGVPRSTLAGAPKWKDEKRLCAFTFRSAPTSTAKSLLGCRSTTQANPRQFAENAGDPIRYSGEISGDVKSLLAEVKTPLTEGLIAKQRKSVYEPGRRSGTWIKLKCLNDRNCNWRLHAARRLSQTLRCVLVGYYEDKTKKRQLSQNLPGKVGSGFTAKALSILSKRFREEETRRMSVCRSAVETRR